MSYLTEIIVDASPSDGNQTIELDYSFLAESTGQPGVAHVDVLKVEVNYGLVENGDNGTPPNPGLSVLGLDSGISDDRQTISGGDTGVGGSTAVIISEAFDPPGSTPFDPDPADEVKLTFSEEGRFSLSERPGQPWRKRG